jgi:mannose-6-phosphate isomerase-like protein (cupin superfamily)
MSYPPRVYDGSEGEITATFRPTDSPADIVYPSGGTADYLATGATTGGKFGLYRWNMSATPAGPDKHFHRTMTESFFILSGTVRIFNGDKWLDTRPGDFVHVPEGGVHGFRNESGEPASMLILFSPGAPREGYFEGLLDMANKSEEQKLAFYLEHDNYWL